VTEVTPDPARLEAQTIKPIETRYAGYRFRSRLEARWAVFFDRLSIEWRYEPEGFQMSTGVKYLPDFYLPVQDLWVEVKAVMSHSDLVKILRAARELPIREPASLGPRLVILAGIPGPDEYERAGLRSGVAMHSTLSVLDDYIVWGRSFFSPSKWLVPFDRPIHWFPNWSESGLNEATSEKYRGEMTRQASTRLIEADAATLEAYEAARHARFEYGESGAPTRLDAVRRRPLALVDKPPVRRRRKGAQSKEAVLTTASLRKVWPALREAFFKVYPQAMDAFAPVSDVGFRYGKVTLFTYDDPDQIEGAPWFEALQETFRNATKSQVRVVCIASQHVKATEERPRVALGE
jgi:hypothetical protein